MSRPAPAASAIRCCGSRNRCAKISSTARSPPALRSGITRSSLIRAEHWTSRRPRGYALSARPSRSFWAGVMELSAVPGPSKIVRNPEASRARILEAARIEFVSHGLSGGRVDRIAEQSDVNKNLIYHYFGSKDALYLAVLERIYADLRTRPQDQDLRGLPPVEGMKRLVSNTFDHFVATPDLIRLMSIENIHYAEHLKSSNSTKSLYNGL